MTTPTFVFMSGPKEAKNGTLVKQTLGVTDLIYGMYTQLDFGSNMGGMATLVCKKKRSQYNAWTKGVRSTNTL